MVDSSTIVNEGENKKNNILNKKINAIDWSKMSKKIYALIMNIPLQQKIIVLILIIVQK